MCYVWIFFSYKMAIGWLRIKIWNVVHLHSAFSSCPSHTFTLGWIKTNTHFTVTGRALGVIKNIMLDTVIHTHFLSFLISPHCNALSFSSFFAPLTCTNVQHHSSRCKRITVVHVLHNTPNTSDSNEEKHTPRARYTLLGHIEIDENELEKETWCIFSIWPYDKEARGREFFGTVFAALYILWNVDDDDSAAQVGISECDDCRLSTYVDGRLMRPNWISVSCGGIFCIRLCGDASPQATLI